MEYISTNIFHPNNQPSKKVFMDQDSEKLEIAFINITLLIIFKITVTIILNNAKYRYSALEERQLNCAYFLIANK